MQHPTGHRAEDRRAKIEFGRDLRVARRRAGLTQQQLADRLGITQPYVSQVERGERNLTLSAVAAFVVAVGCTYAIELIPTTDGSNDRQNKR